jgi:hypothetical protein
VYSLSEIGKYCSQQKGRVCIILDTNILHLLLVGIYDKNYIASCELVCHIYTPQDFDILGEILRYFQPAIIITPTVLAEISNQSKIKVKDPHFHIYLQRMIDKLKQCKEINFPLEKLLRINMALLRDFGFTDMSIIEIAKEINAVILTDEVAMHARFNTSMPIIKFSHIKANRIGISIP